MLVLFRWCDFIYFIFLRFCGSEGKLCNDVTQFTFTTSSAHRRAILHWNEVAAGAWMPVRWLWGLEILNNKKKKVNEESPEAPPPVCFLPVSLGCSARGLHRPFECVSSAFRDQSWLTCCHSSEICFCGHFVRVRMRLTGDWWASLSPCSVSVCAVVLVRRINGFPCVFFHCAGGRGCLKGRKGVWGPTWKWQQFYCLYIKWFYFLCAD